MDTQDGIPWVGRKSCVLRSLGAFKKSAGARYGRNTTSGEIVVVGYKARCTFSAK
jgi:nucleoid DNA-binding protein